MASPCMTPPIATPQMPDAGEWMLLDYMVFGLRELHVCGVGVAPKALI